MVEFSKLTPAELIASDGFKCDCGAIHATTGLKIIKMGRGVSSEVGKSSVSWVFHAPLLLPTRTSTRQRVKKLSRYLMNRVFPTFFI